MTVTSVCWLFWLFYIVRVSTLLYSRDIELLCILYVQQWAVAVSVFSVIVNSFVSFTFVSVI